MSLALHATLLISSLTAAALWPPAGFVATWLSLWGLSLCDRRVKTTSARVPMVRRYQFSLWITFWGSLFWLGTMAP